MIFTRPLLKEIRTTNNMLIYKIIAHNKLHSAGMPFKWIEQPGGHSDFKTSGLVLTLGPLTLAIDLLDPADPASDTAPSDDAALGGGMDSGCTATDEDEDEDELGSPLGSAVATREDEEADAHTDG